jgi:hypothetical protein
MLKEQRRNFKKNAKLADNFSDENMEESDESSYKPKDQS